MNLEEVAERFEAKKTNDGYRARCPVHNGQSKNSLHISPADGKVLVYCHGGCRTDDVLGAVGLSYSDIGGESKRESPAATYVYRDENGVELMRVHRKANKEFKQQSATGEWSVKNVRKVIYRYPEILNAIERDEPIWVVEGEKDVENLWRLGLPATCNAGGADKWSIEHTKCLASSKHVIIVADKDEPGRKHAQAVAKSLAVVLDRAIQIIEVPEGKDASDWISMGASAEDFRGLARPDPGLRIVGAEEKPKLKSRSLTAKQICSEVPEAIQEIAPYVAIGHITSLEGYAKSGKTTYLLKMLRAIVLGEMFLDRMTIKGPIMYLTEEDDSFAASLRDVELENCDDFRVFRRRELADLEWPVKVEQAVAECKEFGASVLVVDTLSRWSGIQDENDASQMLAAMEPLGRARATGLAVIVVRHTKKAEEANFVKASRGSSAGAGEMDIILNFGPMPSGEPTQRRIQYQGRPRMAPELVVDFDEDTGEYTRIGTPDEAKRDKHRHLVAAALRTTPDSMTIEVLREYLKSNAPIGSKAPKMSTVRSVIATLIGAGEVRKDGRGTKGDPYRFTSLSEPSR